MLGCVAVVVTGVCASTLGRSFAPCFAVFPRALDDFLAYAPAAQVHNGTHLTHDLLTTQPYCHTVLSPHTGQAVLYHSFGQPQRLQPGAVIGLEQVLQRMPAPLQVSTDPHFPAHIASLSWHKYEHAIHSWAAQQVREGALGGRGGWLSLYLDRAL